MDITPLIPKGKQIITGYGDGGFKINNENVKGSLLVFTDHILQWSGDISIEQLTPVLQAEPLVELLLVGTGKQSALISDNVRQSLKSRGINVESMDTGAACRTYNVLMSEERRVAAALIAI